jgi:hypothetical protein
VGLQDELLARMQKDLDELLETARAQISKRQFAAATKILGDGYKQLFGLDRRFLQLMDAAQAAALLGKPEKIFCFALLLCEEAEVLKQQHDVESASATAKWAMRMLGTAKLANGPQGLVGLLARLRTLSTS